MSKLGCHAYTVPVLEALGLPVSTELLGLSPEYSVIWLTSDCIVLDLMCNAILSNVVAALWNVVAALCTF